MTCACGHPQNSHEALYGSCRECMCTGFTSIQEGTEDNYPPVPNGEPLSNTTLRKALYTSVDVALGTMFLAAFAGAGLFSIPMGVLVGFITFAVLMNYQDN